MTSLDQRKSIYQQAANATHQRNLQKFRVETNDYFCKYEDELIALIKKIPNWKTYLTDKQLKITQLYVNFLNTSAVDNNLKLTNGITYHTLFGNVKNSKQVGGVLKKLRTVNNTLEEIENKKGNKK